MLLTHLPSYAEPTPWSNSHPFRDFGCASLLDADPFPHHLGYFRAGRACERGLRSEYFRKTDLVQKICKHR